MIAAPPRLRDPLAILAEKLDAGSARYANDREREACAADVRHFAGHAWILHPESGPIPFRPWGWQPTLLALFMAERLLSILKARQLGVSWLAAIYALWTAMFRAGQTVLLVSTTQKEADKLLAKVTFVFHRLPEWMRPRYTENTSSLAFPDLNSEIEALPATENVGRSLTASLVILDEHGHQRWARKIYLALKPVVEKGRLFSISTANGQGALHTQLYLAAKAGTNGFRAVFIPWSAHPDRDAAWRERARTELSSLSDAEFTQEYPANDLEAIATTGRPVFPDTDLRRQPMEAGEPFGGPGATIYRAPEAGKVYIAGADTSEGLAAGDWSYASVVERDSGEQVAVMAGRWTPDVYAVRLDRLARHFGQHADAHNPQPVIVAVERNNHGHAVLLRLSQLRGDSAPYAIFRFKDGRLGWLTSSATRPVLVDQLEEALRTDATLIHDATTVDQMSTFSWNDDGRPEATEGYHDDAVLALGIAIQVRRRSYGRVLTMRRPAA